MSLGKRIGLSERDVGLVDKCGSEHPEAELSVRILRGLERQGGRKVVHRRRKPRGEPPDATAVLAEAAEDAPEVV